MLVTISGRTFYLSGLCTQTVISCTHNGFTRIHVWLLWIRDIYLYYGTSAVDWRRHNAIWALSRWFFKISRFHFVITLILRFEQNLMCKCFLRINSLSASFLYLSKYCRVIFQFRFRQIQKSVLNASIHPQHRFIYLSKYCRMIFQFRLARYKKVFLRGYLSQNSIILTLFKLRNFKISLKSIRFPVKIPIFAASNK